MVAAKVSRRERDDVRRVGLVVRVSTDIQASNPEGSLVTQLQRLRQQVAYKRDTIGEPWEETQRASSIGFAKRFLRTASTGRCVAR